MDGINPRIGNKIQAVERRYNAENDIIPGAPAVTYTDLQLLEIVKDLLETNKYLMARIEQLEKQVYEICN